MRPSVGLLGLVLLLAPTALAQQNLPDLKTVSAPNGPQTTNKPQDTSTGKPAATSNQDSKKTDATSTVQVTTSAPAATSAPATTTQDPPPASIKHPSNLPTLAGVGIPNVIVPDTKMAPYMQKSTLPDGTVFICVGAALGFFGAAILAWRGLVAWSLHRSVKRAAAVQNMADMKAMTAVPGKKRGMYNVVGANSNMSLDRLSAAPTGTSRPPKPFASPTSGTPPRNNSSLFFSPTAAGAASRDSVNRSSNYLPAGYYPSGNAQAASGSPVMQVGGHGSHLSTHSLATPGNRFSSRSGISPPGSPSLPPSRGYDRAPPSRDGLNSIYNRGSVATLGNQAPPMPGSRGVYGQDAGNMSQLSLNVPGGTSVAGGRAPSAYLEDLFENHGTQGAPTSPGAGGNGAGNQRF